MLWDEEDITNAKTDFVIRGFLDADRPGSMGDVEQLITFRVL
jgi:hypothetical protein